MKKHVLALLLTVAVALVGCGQGEKVTEEITEDVVAEEVEEEIAEEEPIKVISTIFPIYDWVSNVAGDEEIVVNDFIVDDGIDLHSFQPTVDDIVQISDCDLFIYIGGNSDDWVEDALAQATNPDMIVLNLTEVLGNNVKMEVSVEGMQGSGHSHEHGEEEISHISKEDEHHEDATLEDLHEHDDEDIFEHEQEESNHTHEHSHIDEHIWLSLKNASIASDAIGNVLYHLTNNTQYLTNAIEYQAELARLDSEYEEMVEMSYRDTILVADRFPFRYLADDYGLTYYAAFSGCSAETEASFETIVFLAEKVDELNLKAVLSIEGDSNRLAETVVANTLKENQEVLILYSMQSTTRADAENGASYLAIMKDNYEVLRKALN